MFTDGSAVSIIVGRSSTHENTLPAIFATKWSNLSKPTTAIRLVGRAFRDQTKALGTLVFNIMLLLSPHGTNTSLFFPRALDLINHQPTKNQPDPPRSPKPKPPLFAAVFRIRSSERGERQRNGSEVEAFEQKSVFAVVYEAQLAAKPDCPGRGAHVTADGGKERV